MSPRLTKNFWRGPPRNSRGWSWNSSWIAAAIKNPHVAEYHKDAARVRAAGLAAAKSHMQSAVPGGHHHAPGARPASTPLLEPQPVLNAILETQSGRFGRRLLLWQADRTELAAFGGELDMAVQMPGWTNVWTMPIQNRVDMLSTGVNTPIGIRVLGRNVDDVMRGSEEVARVVKPLRGAVDVVADPDRAASPTSRSGSIGRGRPHSASASARSTT